MAWEILAAAGIGAATSLFGADKQGEAAKDAAEAQARASQQQINLQRDIYQDQRMLQQPYYQGGLQAMYGGAGLMNLLGHGAGPSQAVPSQQTPQAQIGTAQPQNAFADYASGNYGVQTPAEQTSNRWQSYLDANPDVNTYINANPRVLREFDGDRLAVAEHHYNAFGRGEGRGFGEPAAPASAPAAASPVIQTTEVAPGQYMPTGKQPDQMAAMGEAAPQEGPTTQTLRQTPGYQFMQDETRRMREGSAAARGELLSGSAIAEADRQVLGLADQTYQQSVNNQFNLANLGMGAAAQIQNAGTNFGIGAGNAMGRAGDAQAAGYYGRANAFNAGLQGVGDAVMGGVGMYTGAGGGGGGNNRSFTFDQTGGNRTGWVSN